MAGRTIHVAKACTLVLAGDVRVPYGVGVHHDVPDEHADHWFLQAHCVSEEAAPEAEAPQTDDILQLREALAAERARVEALEQNAARFEEAFGRVSAERNEAAAARDAALAEVGSLKAEVARVTEALGKAEADLEAATAPKGDEAQATEARPTAKKPGAR